jgi:hypothetical protein
VKHRNLIFNEKYYIEVLNPHGEPDPVLANHLTKMCDAAGVETLGQDEASLDGCVLVWDEPIQSRVGLF